MERRPWSTQTQAFVLGLAGAAVVVGAAVAARRPPLGVPADETVLHLVTSATYAGVAVLVVRWRGATRIAVLLLVTGGVHWAGFLSNANDPLVFTVGGVLAGRHLAPLAHLLLALPSGRVERSVDRIAVVLVYVAAGVSVLAALFDQCDPVPGFGCPGNVLLVADDPGMVARLGVLTDVLGVVALVTVVGALADRWLRGSTALRRVVAPGYAAGIALLATWLTPRLGGMRSDGAAPLLLGQLATAGVPLAVAVGLLRGRLPQGGHGDLARLAASGEVEGALDAAVRRALGDPSARVVVREHGTAMTSSDATTLVADDGERQALLVHDPALLAEPEVLDAVVATVAIAVRNQWLADAVERQLDEVQASRARVVAAADDERRRIERNLHDGAQQRLLALSMKLHGARTAPDGQQGRELDGAITELEAVLADLRELARGLHPAVLEERGLEAAVEALAERTPVPVEVLSERSVLPSPEVAAAAYYVIAESLTNVVRHASATHATVDLRAQGGELAVVVTDDGAGGAAARRGGGLEGLQDRVAALGGILTVTSSATTGTRVVAVLPCEVAR